MLPPRTVLAAVDFSQPSAVALSFAARLAGQAGAACRVVYAEDPLLADAARQAGIDLAGDTREELGRFVGSTLGDAARVGQVVETGSPVEVILAVAGRIHADVIVIGSHGMSGAERLMFGSTAEGVLRRAPLPVIVTPPSWDPPNRETQDLSGIGPVVVGLDFGDTSPLTLAAACRFASLLRASVEAVHVVPSPPVLARWRGHAEAAARSQAAAARQSLERLIREAGCPVAARGSVETGSVPERIAEAAHATQGRSPVLVLGRHRRGEKAGPPGAIAYRVLSLARVPVLLYVHEP